MSGPNHAGTAAGASTRVAEASRRVQADAGGHADIEALDAAVERDADDAIAALAGEPAQSGPFGAQHPGEGSAEVGLGQALPAGIGADDPQAELLQLPERARKIGDG